MTIQDELRRLADLTFGFRRDVLNAAAQEIDELEREVERLKAAQQEGK